MILKQKTKNYRCIVFTSSFLISFHHQNVHKLGSSLYSKNLCFLCIYNKSNFCVFAVYGKIKQVWPLSISSAIFCTIQHILLHCDHSRTNRHTHQGCAANLPNLPNLPSTANFKKVDLPNLPSSANFEICRTRQKFDSTILTKTVDFFAKNLEASDDVIIRSWIAVAGISLFSIDLYAIFGFLTMSKLTENTLHMSKTTTTIQKALLKALIVQTIIPIFVIFSPCILCWFSPIFNINLGRGFNYLEVLALSAFPFFDPLAIILCLPPLRKRVLFKKSKTNITKNCALN
nr:hypothetical protein T07C12.5 - Caenorhabditis elegans [Caenorhabditis elegans]